MYESARLAARVLRAFCRARSSAMDGCRGCPFDYRREGNRWGCIIRCPEEWPLELTGEEGKI